MTAFCLSSRAGLRTVLLATAAIALAACAGAGGKWTKAGVGEEAMAADLEECELFGQAAGLSAANQPDNTYPGVGISSSGLTVNAPTQIPEAGTSGYAAQGDAFASCMEARGYKLAAAP